MQNAHLRGRLSINGGEGGSGPGSCTPDVSPMIFLPGTPIQDMVEVLKYRQKRTVES